MAIDENLQRELETEDDFSGPVKQDERFSPENMTSVIDKFVESEIRTSKEIKVKKDEDGKITTLRYPTEYMERMTPDAATGNLDNFEKLFTEEAYNIAQTIQFVESQTGWNLKTAANYFTELGHQCANISKGKDFALLKNIRTDRSEATSRSERTVNSGLQQKRKWF